VRRANGACLTGLGAPHATQAVEKPLSNRARKRQASLLRRAEREARGASKAAAGADADGDDTEDAEEPPAPKRHKADAADGKPAKAREPKQKAKAPGGTTPNGSSAKKDSTKPSAAEKKDSAKPAATEKKGSARQQAPGKPADTPKKEAPTPKAATDGKKDSAKPAVDAKKASAKPQAPGKPADPPKKETPAPAPPPVKKDAAKATEAASKKDAAPPAPAAPKPAAPKPAAAKPATPGKAAEPAKASASPAGKAAAALPTKVVALDAKRKQLLQQVRGLLRAEPTAPREPCSRLIDHLRGSPPSADGPASHQPHAVAQAAGRGRAPGQACGRDAHGVPRRQDAGPAGQDAAQAAGRPLPLDQRAAVHRAQQGGRGHFPARARALRRSAFQPMRARKGRARRLSDALAGLVGFAGGQYHTGFAEQVSKWPVNPVDIFIRELRSYPKGTVIGDFGCGVAALAAGLPQHKVHSFDLVAANERVTACDIANVRRRAPCGAHGANRGADTARAGNAVCANAA